MKTSSQAIIDKEKALLEKAGKGREAAFNRFPLGFALLGTFGVVAIFYGFEGLIDRIDILANNPWILLATGLAILAATGTLYKKLQ